MRKSVDDYYGEIKSEFLTKIENIFNNNENILILEETTCPWILSPEAIKYSRKKYIYLYLI